MKQLGDDGIRDDGDDDDSSNKTLKAQHTQQTQCKYCNSVKVHYEKMLRWE